jgi:hypothetical protein
MRLALIPPVSLLGATFRTDYQLMLPQLCDNPTYAGAYRSHCKDPRTYVILDNGAAEGHAPNKIELLQYANRFKVDEIVLPDVLGDMNKTLELSRECLDYMHMTTTIKQFNTMFVCQGADQFEFVERADIAARWPEVTSIGIPRHTLVTCDNKLARVSIANILQSGERFNKQIHFLGASPFSPTEAKLLADPSVTTQRLVRGMDTSMPFNYAYKLMNLRDGVVVNRVDDYFSLPSDAFDVGFLQQQIDTYLKWVGLISEERTS